jgi:hypothetical protein
MSRAALLALALVVACKNEVPNDQDSDGVTDVDDCDDGSADVGPGHEELPYNGVDDDCDAATPDDDLDGDGYGVEQDCDDADATVHPGAEELVGDGVDQDCDLETPDDPLLLDDDGDGVPAADDCDDTNPEISPDAVEHCDGVDENCDGLGDAGAVDEREFFSDDDGDGHGEPTGVILSCEKPEGFSESDGDCDDEDATINPDADEVCDGFDNDCDDRTDPPDAADAAAWFADDDGDGWGGAIVLDACEEPEGFTDTDGDCNDTTDTAYPGAAEVCDGIDNDCDGTSDEDVTTTYYADSDADGFGGAVTVAACAAPDGYVAVGGDCNDSATSASPTGVEACDGLDNDCDGATDEDVTTTFFVDADGDGVGTDASITACTLPDGYAATSGDCDDTTGRVSPATAETCDDVDNDCDGVVDDGVLTSYFFDGDDDGFGGDTTVEACAAPADYVELPGDCNDTDARATPAGTETCDRVDNDCDGTIDDGVTTTFYADGDGDGVGGVETLAACAAPTGFVTTTGDCDDSAAAAYPGGVEVCDGLDNDCDGTTDPATLADASTWFLDLDLDGFGDLAATEIACDAPSGYVADATDCDDADASVNPAATEVCENHVDDNCDGAAGDCDSKGDMAISGCDVKILGAKVGHEAGFALTRVGDVNDDGYADIAIGATHRSTGSDNLGEVYLVDGRVTGHYDLSDPKSLGYTTRVYKGATAKDGFATNFSVADVTGDGVKDIAIGAPYTLDTTYRACLAGTISVWSGPLDRTTTPITTSSAIATMRGLEFYRATTGSLYCENDVVGYRVATGDVSGDGVADVISGSNWPMALGSSNAAYVFNGPVSGAIGAKSASTIVNPSVKEASFSSYLTVGWADLDGDGADDLMLGHPTNDSGGVADAGAVYVFYGPVDTGTIDVLAPDAVIRGTYVTGYFGNVYSHEATGDFDGDGFTDLLIGAYGDTDYGADAGAVYLFRGPIVGALTTDDAIATWYGPNPGDEQADAASAGDFNGDGIADVILGADGSDYGGDRGGAAFVFYGPVGGDYFPEDADFVLYGATGDEVGFWVSGIGDGDGDGFDDIAITAPWDDENGANAGAVYICRGTGR